MQTFALFFLNYINALLILMFIMNILLNRTLAQIDRCNKRTQIDTETIHWTLVVHNSVISQ